MNCVSAPQALSVVKTLHATTDKPLLACPNSGEIWDNGAHDWRPAPVGAASLAEAVTDLVAAGASLLGGCCRVGSTEIRQLRAFILPATSGSSGQ